VPDGVDDALHIEFAYNCGGYGLYDEEVESTIERLLRTDGIPLDPTYTGKAYRGMLSYLDSQRIVGKNVLFLHTGGLPLFFDYLATRNGVA
jgi:D-cysteine desulfhydrase